MGTTSQLSCRSQMALEMADLCERQKVCLILDRRLIELLVDNDRLPLFQNIFTDDEKTLSLLETTRMEHGLPALPTPFTLSFLNFVTAALNSENARFVDCLDLACFIKNAQIKAGHLLASTLPHLPPDAHLALSLLPSINSCNVAHLRKLDRFGQELFFQSFLGVKSSQGVTSQIKLGLADLAGTFSRPFMRGADEMPITMLLRQEHLKAQALFAEIEATNKPDLAFDLFTQLKLDLSTHSAAEEETFYLPLASLIEAEQLIENSFDEHDKMRTLISEIQDLPPASRQFKSAVVNLQKEVTLHVAKEESVVFSMAEKKFNRMSLKAMSANFMQAKLTLIDEFYPALLAQAG